MMGSPAQLGIGVDLARGKGAAWGRDVEAPQHGVVRAVAITDMVPSSDRVAILAVESDGSASVQYGAVSIGVYDCCRRVRRSSAKNRAVAIGCP